VQDQVSNAMGAELPTEIMCTEVPTPFVLSKVEGAPQTAPLALQSLAGSALSLRQARRSRTGRKADERGRLAEEAAKKALERDGWCILASRLRTSAGEIDMVAEKAGLLAIIEVKARPRLADAAAALSVRQQARLVAATEIILMTHPQWGIEGVRFDLLLVDALGTVRRIADAFRGNG
jgi:putative endonuclease